MVNSRITYRLISIFSPMSQRARSLPRYQLYCALCIQRLPIISSQYTKLEQKYKQFLLDDELRRSKLSDFEIRLTSKTVVDEDEDVDRSSALSPLELLDSWNKELHEFKENHLTAQVISKPDFHDSHRLPDQRLILLVKRTLESSSVWMMPSGHRNRLETMRSAAERVAEDICGNQLKFKVLGNSPVAYYKYRLAKALKEKLGIPGMKVFVYNSWLTSAFSQPLLNAEYTDYAWVASHELDSFVRQEYRNMIFRFLLGVRKKYERRALQNISSKQHIIGMQS